ncbi:MAG: antibiotic biosynthesis monooxygenase [bacterium]|jgi:quinol monooxygenase YgiN|nr:antibiotic biosynthesis monooxygenase [bacterium]
MTRIAIDQDVVTLVNVFSVAPENQEKLLDMLIEATQQTMRHLPGFVSANFHRSLDGTKVINYAQWRTQEDFEAMLANPKAREHMAPITELASAEPHLYQVVFTDSAD